MPRSPSRTLPRNLKRGGVPQPECRVRLSRPPTSATGHLAAAHFRGRAKWGRPYTTRKRSKRAKSPPVGGFFGMSGVRRGPFLPRKASPRPMSPRHRWPVAVVVRRSLAPFSHSLLCGVSLRKNATLWPFHLLTPAPPKEILKEEIAVAGKKRSKRQKAHPLGGFFCFSTKMPIAARP